MISLNRIAKQALARGANVKENGSLPPIPGNSLRQLRLASSKVSKRSREPSDVAELKTGWPGREAISPRFPMPSHPVSADGACGFRHRNGWGVSVFNNRPMRWIGSLAARRYCAEAAPGA